MKKVFLILLLGSFSLSIHAQHLYITNKGNVTFFSEAPLEDIQAENAKTAAIIDADKNEIAVQMKITDFEFPNKLMQEHFNENYLESEKYPTSVFKGKIKEQVNIAEAGTYQVLVDGTLSIHGITQKVQISGTIVSDGKQLKLDFKFPIKLEDYKVEIPTLVFSKIAEIVEVTGKITLIEK